MVDTPLDSKSGFCPSRLNRISHWLDSQIAAHRLAGASVLVSRGATDSYFYANGVAGQSDAVARPFDRNTLVRLYSMTKPVTTVAALMLFEQGKFQLDDPVHWYLPAFGDLRVWNGTGSMLDEAGLYEHTQKLQNHMSVRHLMTHTSGLTYSFMQANAVDEYYRDQNLVFPGSSETLESLVDRLAKAPLLCQPGSEWNYSVATDVLGRLVEIWSGQSLDEFFEQHIFEPLGMSSTGFHIDKGGVERFADLFGPASGGDLSNLGVQSVDTDEKALPLSAPAYPDKPPIPLEAGTNSTFLQKPVLLSGGGGLVGSIDDYGRFCQLLLNGGELDGTRLLGRKSTTFMLCNQLPDNRDMASMGQALWSETSYQGIGFGLGGAVVIDPVKAGLLTSVGEYHWGGAASTFFWVDPEEELYVIFFTQLYPSSTYPLRKELRTAVYQSLI